jgi:glycosyltransferase involved in cell wall biosynthesis
MSDLLASVIVPARNSAADLRALAACLKRQTVARDRFEVVIGDDGSIDGGAHAVATGDGFIRIAPGPPLNSYAARNRAVRASRAPVLAFCDADCRPEPDWLEKGLAALENTDLAAGRIRFLVPERRTVWTLLDMDGTKDHERQVRQGLAETCNLFVRRELFEGIGGFDDTVAEYGDYEFVERCVAAGLRLDYAPEALLWHPARVHARSFLRALWVYNHGYAAREARARRLPEGLKLRNWVPVVQTLRSRRRWGRPIGPDRRWLEENGVRPSTAETLRTLPVIYLLVPYLRGAAQLQGWWAGRQLR